MPAQGASSDSLPSTKACIACRALKVRCIACNAPGKKGCQRCAKSERLCVFPAPQKRKQRKRTDVRVTELESEIRNMKGLLGRDDDGNRPKRADADAISPSSSGASSGAINGQIFEEELAISPERHIPQSHSIDPETIDTATAADLFDIYNKDLVEHYPVVVFPGTLCVERLRIEKPTLFLSVMAAAAMRSQPQLSTTLNKQVLEAYATRIFLNSEKSLELVQSMIVTAVWYSPPDGSSQHKYYEYIHMAATMALDLGLGTKPSRAERSDQQRPENQSPALRETNVMPLPLKEPEGTDIERRRTFLSCYLICCGVAFSMRRPNMLRFSNWMNECLEYLHTSPRAVPSDKILAAWVQLLHISEEIATAFSFDDLNKIVSIEEPKTQVMLKHFEKRLSTWRIDSEPRAMKGSLAIMYHNMNIYLHEIALHGDHRPEQFKPPYHFENLRSDKDSTGSSMDHLQAIIQCITSSHALIETFLHMDVELLRTLPIFNYVRLSYAIYVLEMLATSHAFGSFLNRGSLQINHYSELVIEHLEHVVGPAKCKIPSIFLGLLIRLQAWHRRPGNESTTKAPSLTPSDETSLHCSRRNQSSDVVTDSLMVFDDTDDVAAGSKNPNIASDNANGLPHATPSAIAPLNPTFQPNTFQNLSLDHSQLPTYLTSQAGQPGAAHGYTPLLDLSGDYQMNLDPDNLFLFSGMDNLNDDSMNYPNVTWPMDYGAPTDIEQGQQDDSTPG